MPGFPLSLFGLLVCFTDDMVPLPVLQSGETHVLQMKDGYQNPAQEVCYFGTAGVWADTLAFLLIFCTFHAEAFSSEAGSNHDLFSSTSRQ